MFTCLFLLSLFGLAWAEAGDPAKTDLAHNASSVLEPACFCPSPPACQCRLNFSVPKTCANFTSMPALATATDDDEDGDGSGDASDGKHAKLYFFVEVSLLEIRIAAPALFLRSRKDIIHFYFFHYFSELSVRYLHAAPSNSTDLVFGRCAGLTSTVICQPFDVFRTRLTGQGSKKGAHLNGTIRMGSKPEFWSKLVIRAICSTFQNIDPT
ncbi:unnamed protein product [Schistocephalus solidus]|uniref:Secreted protein n=1 Tax=Schistocephalus solidus TaxID=70667 RepID=A0A183SLS1_SCHSO|nr:unnamed protein product [Schistocephalus solidus]